MILYVCVYYVACVSQQPCLFHVESPLVFGRQRDAQAPGQTRHGQRQTSFWGLKDWGGKNRTLFKDDIVCNLFTIFIKGVC